MAYKFDKIFLFGLVTALLVFQSSTSTPMGNDLLEALMIRLEGMQYKVKLLEANSTNKEVEIQLLEAKDIAKEEKIDLLEAKNAKKMDEIVKLKSKMTSIPEYRHIPTFTNRNLNKNKMKSGDSSMTRAAGPSSCSDLSVIGYILDGLYVVQNRVTKMIETVLCNFGTSPSQKLIGNVEVKTKNVHFYVQRESSFVTVNANVNYDLELLNEGGAMDLRSGIFTAPVDGIYHFEFSAVKDGVSSLLEIIFNAGGRQIGLTYNDDGSASGMFMCLSLAASLRLKANDQAYFLNVFGGQITGGTIHFTGWLVEEDLV